MRVALQLLAGRSRAIIIGIPLADGRLTGLHAAVPCDHTTRITMQHSKLAALLLAAGLAAQAQAADLLNEGFDSIAALGSAGWVFTNTSAPAGLGWFQGNAGIFTAQAGAADAYIAANFNSSASATGTVDNWLISPVLSLGAGATLSFYTRASDADFLDALEVRFSAGPDAALSGFSLLLATVGSTTAATYPVGSWRAVTVQLPSLDAGRFAFHYTVPNALDASYIGIDSVTVTAVPEPAPALLLGLGVAALCLARRQQPST
jgi:hypothetical protein